MSSVISTVADTILHEPSGAQENAARAASEPVPVLTVDSGKRRDHDSGLLPEERTTPATPQRKDVTKEPIDPLPAPDQNKLAITCRSEQNTSPSHYTKGDTVRLFFKVNKPCYTRFLYHLADGRIVMLAKDREIAQDETGRMLEINNFQLDAPYGKERLYVFAQNRPIWNCTSNPRSTIATMTSCLMTYSWP